MQAFVRWPSNLPPKPLLMKNTTPLHSIALAAVVFGLSACSADVPTNPALHAGPATASSSTTPFAITSTAFNNGDAFPGQYFCPFYPGGTNEPPPLAWSGAPAAAKSLALVLDDPDAVPVPTTFTHWITWNMSAGSSMLGPGRSGRMTGANDIADYATHHGAPASLYFDYFGPCPPPGTGVHRYTFHLYALDAVLRLPAGSRRAAFDNAIAGHVLAEARLMGTVDAGTP